VLQIVHGDTQAAVKWSGVAVGISPLMTALAGPFWGAIAERYGARRSMLRTILTAVGLVFLLSFAMEIWQLLVLRALAGLLGGFYVLVHALAAQTAPRERVGQAIGMLQAVQMACLALTPPIAGLLTDYWGLRSNIVLGCGIMFISFVAMLLMYKTPERVAGTADTRPKQNQEGSYWTLLANRELGIVAIIVFVSQYVERTFWPLAPLMILDLEPGSTQLGLLTGLVVGLGSAATALSALAAGRLSRRYSARTLLLVTLGCGCLTIPPLALAGSVWQFIGMRIVMGLFTGGTVTLAYAHGSRILPAERLSAGFSMFASVAMMAAAVGPISLSPLAATFGLRSPLLVSTAAFGGCLIVLLATMRSGKTTDLAPIERGGQALS
jgi:MFS family permease